MRLFSDDCDTYIATDEAELHKIRAEAGSESRPDEWSEVPSDQMFSMWDGERGAEGSTLVTKTAREWAETNPRGFLCSTEC